MTEFNHQLGHKHLSASLLTDSKLLFDFFKQCKAFIRLIFNHDDTNLEANDFIHERPKNKSAADKLPIGIFNSQGSLIAVLDVIKNYPHTGSWYIGLLMLPPLHRSKNLGSNIFQSFENTIRSLHGKEINLIVQEKNPKARKFWEKHGFDVTRESVQELENCQNLVFHMRKLVTLSVSQDECNNY